MSFLCEEGDNKAVFLFVLLPVPHKAINTENKTERVIIVFKTIFYIGNIVILIVLKAKKKKKKREKFLAVFPLFLTYFFLCI